MPPPTREHDDLRRPAAEQAALRRVATLVARGAPEQEIYEALTTEVGRVMPAADANLLRFEGDGMATMIGRWNARLGYLTIEATLPVGSGTLAQRIADTGRPSRITSYAGSTGPLAEMIRGWGWRSSVGAPVIVDARVWGLTAVGSTTDRQLPPDAEQRLAAFTELLAIAIANAESRAALQQLAEEQSALLRVAERVARGDAPDEVFAAVATEARQLLHGQPVTLVRFEDGSALEVLSRSGGPAAPGTRIAYRPRTLPDRVRRTARPARVDDYRAELDAGLARDFGLSAAVAAPIVVDGRVWGMLTATSSDGRLSAGIEDRLQRFANLVGTAVGNATSHAQLIASRARVLSTADETRRQLQRDVHDGAQQRLVQTVICLKLAEQALAAGDAPAGARRIAEGLDHAQRATDELRELVRGILPSGLTRKGLPGGVESLAAAFPLPVRVAIDVPRMPAEIETTAYFVVAEALTNVVKHARAGRVDVRAAVDDGVLRVAVTDDGVGGARAGAGSGLVGLFDRVEARGGRLQVHSAAGEGTTVAAELPL